MTQTQIALIKIRQPHYLSVCHRTMRGSAHPVSPPQRVMSSFATIEAVHTAVLRQLIDAVNLPPTLHLLAVLLTD